jgi:large subunit ribosomal protein L23
MNAVNKETDGKPSKAASKAAGSKGKARRDKSAPPTAAEVAAMRVVLAPVVSEKSTMVGEKHNQVAFRVTGDATKTEVRAAIEAFFKVDVAAVNMVNTRGKTRRSGRSVGRRQDTRKAYVTLAPGQEINFAESK